MKPALRIGLTGDVGGGKSTVLRWLAGRGVVTADADAVVHRLLAEDGAVGAAVSARFGPRVGGTGSPVDRAELGRIVFGDARARADLEAMLHPRVQAELREWLRAADSGPRALEAIYLATSPLRTELTELWLIMADPAERRRRLAARGWSAEEIERRMAAAPPLAPRLAAADRVIDNSGSREATEAQLQWAWRKVETA